MKNFLYALLLCILLVPASLCAAEITDEDMALGGIRIGDTMWAVQKLYGKGAHVADGVQEYNGEMVGLRAYDYGHTLVVEYRKDPDMYRVTSVSLGVNDVNDDIHAPSEDARRFETPRGIHLDSTRADLEAAYGYIPKPNCSHNAPPVCGYFYEGESASLTFYICPKHSTGIHSILLREKSSNKIRKRLLV